MIDDERLRYYRDLEARLDALLAAVSHLVPFETAESVADYVTRHGEYGVGFELLVDALHETQVQLDAKDIVEARSLAELMGIPESVPTDFGAGTSPH